MRLNAVKGLLGPALWMGAGAALVYALLALTSNNEARTKEDAKRTNTRRVAAEQIIKAGPTTESHYTDEGQLVVLKIPSRVGGVSGLVETKRCFVWRDAAYRTTAMACEGTNEDRFDLPQEDNGTLPE